MNFFYVFIATLKSSYRHVNFVDMLVIFIIILSLTKLIYRVIQKVSA